MDVRTTFLNAGMEKKKATITIDQRRSHTDDVDNKATWYELFLYQPKVNLLEEDKKRYQSSTGTVIHLGHVSAMKSFPPSISWQGLDRYHIGF